MSAGQNEPNVLFEPIPECACPKRCVRHGHCEECRKFHASAKRPRPPYCERERKPSLLKRLFGN